MINQENLEGLPSAGQPVVEQISPKKFEQVHEIPVIKIESTEKQESPRPATSVVKSAPVIKPIVKDPLQKKVEDILESGLGDAYLKLSPEKKQEFKEVGEQTAQKITVLLHQTKIKIRQIFSLIIKWLKVIPGVNIFFLEQEAKIKTDQLIKLNQQNKD